MGRGVDYDVNAACVWHFDVSDFEDSWEWDDFITGLRDLLSAKYKSLETSDKWASNERREILENNLATLSVAEYCGCASLSLSPKTFECWTMQHLNNISGPWCASVIGTMDRLLQDTYGTMLLTKMGTMSNGVSVYQRTIA